MIKAFLDLSLFFGQVTITMIKAIIVVFTVIKAIVTRKKTRFRY
jgi:hypothetical protein